VTIPKSQWSETITAREAFEVKSIYAKSTQRIPEPYQRLIYLPPRVNTMKLMKFPTNLRILEVHELMKAEDLGVNRRRAYTRLCEFSI